MFLGPSNSSSQSEEFYEFAAQGFSGDATEEHCLDLDPDDPYDEDCAYNSIDRIDCQLKDSGDWVFVTTSCPQLDDTRFRFAVAGDSIVFSLDFSDDPVAAVWQGNVMQSNEGYTCSDDTIYIWRLLGWEIPIQTLIPQVASPNFLVGVGDPVGEAGVGREAVLTSGAGVRGFYVHQSLPYLDWTKLRYALMLPKAAVNDPYPTN